MDDQVKAAQADTLDAVVVPDVATEPHPGAHGLPGDAPGAAPGLLQDALPQITEAARKVGGFKRLAEIAGQLDRDGSRP